MWQGPLKYSVYFLTRNIADMTIDTKTLIQCSVVFMQLNYQV